MKRMISFILASALLVSGLHPVSILADEVPETEEAIEFKSLSDPNLLQYVQDDIYADLEDHFNSDDYVINDVNVIYISQEYLEELEYNSKTNIFFGYSLADIEDQFQDTKYVFTLGENGETEVQEMQEFEDHTFETVIKNVAIGSGVILVCVTISAVTAGAGAPVVSAVFAASAKTGATFALSSGVFGAVSAGIVEGLETHNLEDALNAAAVGGSEGFKWGAITGAVAGGASKAIALSRPIPSPREAELAALKQYGGSEQVSFLGGEEVSYFTPGATRPDVVRTGADGIIEAIEVKDYNLMSSASRSTLQKELTRQISSRVENLPAGSTQRIVLNVEGRHYTGAFLEETRAWISGFLSDIYPNIPIDFMGAVL